VDGNEEVDKHAKMAAESGQNNSPLTELPHFLRSGALPLSISALKEVHRKATYTRWKHLWRKSPHYAQAGQCNNTNSLYCQRRQAHNESRSGIGSKKIAVSCYQN
jgi:hypothetical protein